MPTYAENFVKHSKGLLDKQTFDNIHRKARSSAGGAAKRGRPVAYRLDKEHFPDQESANAYMYNRLGKNAPHPVEDHDDDWVYPIDPSWRDMPTRSRGIGEGASVEWHKAADGNPEGEALPPEQPAIEEAETVPSEEPVRIDKSSPVAGVLATAWAATVRLLTGSDLVEKDSPTAAQVHVNKPIGEERSSAQKKGKGGKKRPVPASPDDAVTKDYVDGKTQVDKSSPWERLGRTIAERDGVKYEGFAVHIGEDRTPGALSFGLGASDDPATMPWDVGVGVPLPDKCADRVYIAKSAAAAGHAGGLGHLLAEATRVCKEKGIITTVDFDGKELIEKSAPRKSNLEAVLEGCSEERRELILKSVDPNRKIRLAGINREKQIIYAPVLVPEEIHDSLDYMSPEDIEYSCHGYLTNGRLVSGEHNANYINADVVESFIAPVDLTYEGGPYGTQTVPKGSWVAAVKVNDNKEWAKVLAGEYTGFSPGGYGDRTAWQ